MKDLPRTPLGSGPQAHFMRTILDCIRERTPLKTDNYELDQTVNGWRIKPPRSTGGPGSLEQRMIIKTIHDDWFRCLPYDKDGQHPDDAHATDADFILVAKPWELRMTDWDGQTIDGITYDYSTPDQRTATKGSIVETHIVARPWYVGEIIVAVNQVTGGTDATDDNLKDILWEDTNSAAHAWAMVDINDTGGITPESLNVRSVSALLPIKSTGGTRPVISMAPSGVTPGTYGSVTVDTYGRVTAGAAGSGATVNPTDYYMPIRQDATTFVDSPIHVIAGPASGLYAETLLHLYGWANVPFGQTLIANNTAVNATVSFMVLTSDDTDPNNRIFTLGSGYNNTNNDEGFRLLIFWNDGASGFAGKLVNGVSGTQLNSDWAPSTTGEMLELIWYANAWHETGRFPAVAGSGGTTINPTDGALPVRQDSTTFGDSSISESVDDIQISKTVIIEEGVSLGSEADITDLWGGPEHEGFIGISKYVGANTTRFFDALVADAAFDNFSEAKLAALASVDEGFFEASNIVQAKGTAGTFRISLVARNDGTLYLTFDSAAGGTLAGIDPQQGISPPRMTKTQRNAIAGVLDGAIIYQTDNTPGLRVYENGAWVAYTATADP